MKFNAHGRKARLAITSMAIAGLAILIVGVAAGIYFYTLPPATGVTASSTLATSTSGTLTAVYPYTNSSGTFYFTNSSAVAPGTGYCVTNARGQCTNPEGAWTEYLGFIPAGYVFLPHLADAPVYPCPGGMDAANCAVFQASCGDGVCNPNESCSSCPIDCGVPGQLTCGVYSGRPAGPYSVCLGDYCEGNDGPQTNATSNATTSTQSTSSQTALSQGAQLEIPASYVSHSLNGDSVAATCGPTMPAAGASYLEVANTGTAPSTIDTISFSYIDMTTVTDSGAPTGACTVAAGAIEYVTLMGVGVNVASVGEQFTVSVIGNNGGFANISGVFG
jgi:hypothetical protein